MKTLFVGWVKLERNPTNRWNITALAQPVVQWLVKWLDNLSETLELRQAPLKIRSVAITQAPTTYTQLYQARRALKNLENQGTSH